MPPKCSRKPSVSSSLPDISPFLDAFKTVKEETTVGELLRDTTVITAIFSSLFNMMKDAIVAETTDKGHKKPKLESIEASSLKDLNKTVSMFRLDHTIDDEDYLFCLKKPRKIERPAYLEDTLSRMRKATNTWYTESAEALCRTMIDLPIFEMLSGRDQQLAKRRFGLKAEKRVVAILPDKKSQVAGDADYICGYPSAGHAAKETGFESMMVVVEAKKRSTLFDGVPQCVAYLVGLQQNRCRLEPQRMVTAVYGIVSDGTRYIFLRLEERLLLISEIYSMVTKQGADTIFNYIDEILESSISSSPHTTPSKTFPATSSQWREQMEEQRWILHEDYDYTEGTPGEEFVETSVDGGGDDASDDLLGFEILNIDDFPSPLLRRLSVVPKLAEDEAAGPAMDED